MFQTLAACELTCVDQHQSAEEGELVLSELQSAHVMSKVKDGRDQVATGCRRHKAPVNCLVLIRNEM